jgi:hypothetical protein
MVRAKRCHLAPALQQSSTSRTTKAHRKVECTSLRKLSGNGEREDRRQYGVELDRHFFAKHGS